MDNDRVVCSVATALRNMALDSRNKELIGTRTHARTHTMFVILVVPISLHPNQLKHACAAPPCGEHVNRFKKLIIFIK